MANLRPARRLAPGSFTLFLLLVSALGGALVLARQATYGVGLEWDAINYLAVAHHLLEGRGFVNHDGTPYTFWPPLYPTVLAILSLGVLDPLKVAGPLNAALFAALIFVVGSYLRCALKTRFAAAWGALAVALAIPLADVANWAMSGPVFLLLVTLALTQTHRYLAEGRTAALVWAAVFCALAWLTRYIGAAVVATVGLLLVSGGSAPARQRARHVALFALIAGVPMALWLLRNVLSIGALTGSQTAVTYAWPDLLREMGEVLDGWARFALAPEGWEPAQALLRAGTLAAVLLAVTAIPVGYAFAGAQWRSRAATDWRPLSLFGVFAAAYWVALASGLLLGVAHHGVQPRYMAPLYVPLAVIIAFGLDRFLVWERAREFFGTFASLPGVGRALRNSRLAGASPVASVAAAAAVLALAAQIPPSLAEVRRANAPYLVLQSGYNAHPWVSSAIVQYLQEHPLSGLTYSNIPVLAWLHGHDATVRRLPQSRLSENIVSSRATADGRQTLRAWLAHVPEGTQVLWFNNWWTNRLFDYGVADMRAQPGLAPMADLPDGALFRKDSTYMPLANPYELAYQYLADSGQPPAASSFFDVHLTQGQLTYIKAPCAPDDLSARFFLHVYPVAEQDLPPAYRPSGFHNLDFHFPEYGTRVGERCVGVRPLPPYDASRIVTGQYIPGWGERWRVGIQAAEQVAAPILSGGGGGERGEPLTAPSALADNAPPMQSSAQAGPCTKMGAALAPSATPMPSERAGSSSCVIEPRAMLMERGRHRARQVSVE